MTTEEVLAYFGGVKKTAMFLEVWPQTIYQWGAHPPLSKQYEIQVRTNSGLRVTDSAVTNEG